MALIKKKGYVMTVIYADERAPEKRFFETLESAWRKKEELQQNPDIKAVYVSHNRQEMYIEFPGKAG